MERLGGSVQFSCSVMSDSFRPHESQHTRPPCPAPTSGVYSNSCPSSQRCHPAISSSVVPFSYCPLLKVKGWKKIFHANRDQKKAGVAILISDEIDIRTKAVKRDKEGHYLMIKGSIQEEDITIINIYAPNIGAPQYVRQLTTVNKYERGN